MSGYSTADGQRIFSRHRTIRRACVAMSCMAIAINVWIISVSRGTQPECPTVARWAPRPGMHPGSALAVYRRLVARFSAGPIIDGVSWPCMRGPDVPTECCPEFTGPERTVCAAVCAGVDLDGDGDVDLRDFAALNLLATAAFDPKVFRR